MFHSFNSMDPSTDLHQSSLFLADQHLCSADILTPPEVRSRIEVAVLSFLKTLASPNSPAIADLPLIARQSRNSALRRPLLSDVSSLFLSHSFYTRSLSRPTDAKAFIRVWKVMELCFKILGILLSRLVVVSDARYIVVVEKDAIFQRLAEDRLFSQIPCILITAKGYPDIATRFLLHRLSTSFPDMQLLALVDWNPAGLAILCTYKFGSINMGLEAYRYACNIKWLGLRGDDLQLIPQHSFVPLKPRDLQIAKSLMSSTLLQETYRSELASMIESGRRAEIEALYYHGFDFLRKYIERKIVQSDYI